MKERTATFVLAPFSIENLELAALCLNSSRILRFWNLPSGPAILSTIWTFLTNLRPHQPPLLHHDERSTPAQLDSDGSGQALGSEVFWSEAGRFAAGVGDEGVGEVARSDHRLGRDVEVDKDSSVRSWAERAALGQYRSGRRGRKEGTDV